MGGCGGAGVLAAGADCGGGVARVRLVDRPGHLDVLALFTVSLGTWALVAFALALEFFLVKVDVVLFDVDDRLSEERVGFSDERRCNLPRNK